MHQEHNFYAEMAKIIFHLSSNAHFICSSVNGKIRKKLYDKTVRCSVLIFSEI